MTDAPILQWFLGIRAGHSARLSTFDRSGPSAMLAVGPALVGPAAERQQA